MVITNKLELPNALVNAVSPEQHNAENCISATTLLHGAKDIVLSKRHWNEMSEDCSERIYALLGTAVHKIFEENDDTPGAIKEQQFTYPVGKYTVTGRVDLFNPNTATVYDYKNTSVFKIIKGDFHEWYTQLMIYAFLISKAGYKVEHLMIYAVLRDWSRTEARINKGGNYPQNQVVKIPFDITEKDFEFIENFINTKIKEIEAAESMDDNSIPPCSEIERWAEPNKWALMPAKGVKARKLCLSESEAKELCKDNETIEFRPGKSKRCMDYCSCCNFCNFYKENVYEAE